MFGRPPYLVLPNAQLILYRARQGRATRRGLRSAGNIPTPKEASTSVPLSILLRVSVVKKMIATSEA